MSKKKYTKDQLDIAISEFLEPKVEHHTTYAMDSLQEGDMTSFLSAVSMAADDVSQYAVTKCANAKDENTKDDCITKIMNVRARSLNRLGEALVEKCGGKMEYLEEL